MKERIINALLTPFGRLLWLLLTLWLCSSAADFFFNCIHGLPVFGCYMACHGFILSYAVVFCIQFCRDTYASYVRCLLIVLGIINLVVDTMVHSIMHYGFTQDMVAIILGSNFSEAQEFISMYLSSSVLIFLLFTLSIVFFLWYCRNKISSFLGPILKVGALLSVAFFTVVIIVRQSHNWEGVFLCKIRTFCSYDTPVALSKYKSKPLIKAGSVRPENVVLIIGESLSKGHCSLYGYEKQTQPMLNQMTDDSLLFLFSDASSPYVNTIESVKALLSTYSLSENRSDWYQGNVYLQDAMGSGGYHTYWVSNQSSAGFYENLVSQFAHLSDTTIWVGTKGLGRAKNERNDYDELLIYPIQNIIAEQVPHKFLIIHMMGSHEIFSYRYPDSFSIFSESDYEDKPENQRKILSEYDNSVIYNDFIVSTIFRMFEDKNSIVFYLPDHGMDIFVSDSTYIGHARANNTKSFQSGLRIPMIVFPTEEYIKTFPDVIHKLSEMKETPFHAENLMSLVLMAANLQLLTDREDSSYYGTDTPQKNP